MLAEHIPLYQVSIFSETLIQEAYLRQTQEVDLFDNPFEVQIPEHADNNSLQQQSLSDPCLRY